MMGIRTSRLAPLGLALLLAMPGCAVNTPATAYLQLAATTAGSPTGDSPRLFIDRVEMPDFLLRDELIRRDDDFSLHYNPYLRWAEPLDLGIQRVLAEELAVHLDTRQVRRYPAPAGATTQWRLRVRIDRFEREGETVRLQGQGLWSRGDAPDAVVSQVDFDERGRLESEATGATAAALSELLDDFARELADKLIPLSDDPTPDKE
jgi:uncharacterized lipoprotein YmbA